MRRACGWVLTLFFASILPGQAPPAAPTGQKAPVSSDTGSEDFSDSVMNSLLHNLQKGTQGHSDRRVLAGFDPERMDGYLGVEADIQQLFQQYDAFSLHYRILQTSIEGTHGVALVEMQMEATPRQEGTTPLRRTRQIRFEVASGKRGWKIVDFQPRDFFTP